jgi:hypothetical protein
MKTCALYGFISALAQAFLYLALFFLGFHSSVEKLPAAQWIGGVVALVIAVGFTALGVKARRNEVPESEPFGYGRAVWAGVVITFIASVLTSVFSYCYNAFINPGFSDILLQDANNKLEAKGLTGAGLDKMEGLNRTMFTPVPEAVIGLVLGVILGVVIALIVAAVLKRPEPAKVQA